MSAFSMLMRRRPASLRNASAKYKESVENEAKSAFGAREKLAGRLYARMIWFHLNPTQQDVDNIVKPILDALKGVVFEDDFQIGEYYVAKIDSGQTFEFKGEISDTNTENQLKSALQRQETHLVYIEIGFSAEQKVRFDILKEEKPDGSHTI